MKLLFLLLLNLVALDGSFATVCEPTALCRKFVNMTEEIDGLKTRMELMEAKVAKLSSFSILFPRNNVADYVSIQGMPTQLQALTVCFWMRSDDQVKEGSPISYAVTGQANEFLLHSYNDFSVNIGGKHPSSTSGVSATDGQWHHICFTWENTAGSWNIYKDGAREASGTGLQIGHVIRAGGSLILGQDQDSLGGDFDENQSFRGELANLIILGRQVTEQEIAEMATSCNAGPDGAALKFSDIKSGLNGKVSIVQPSSCHP